MDITTLWDSTLQWVWTPDTKNLKRDSKPSKPETCTFTLCGYAAEEYTLDPRVQPAAQVPSDVEAKRVVYGYQRCGRTVLLLQVGGSCPCGGKTGFALFGGLSSGNSRSHAVPGRAQYTWTEDLTWTRACALIFSVDSKFQNVKYVYEFTFEISMRQV